MLNRLAVQAAAVTAFVSGDVIAAPKRTQTIALAIPGSDYSAYSLTLQPSLHVDFDAAFVWGRQVDQLDRHFNRRTVTAASLM
jgi:hypothetical protein